MLKTKSEFISDHFRDLPVYSLEQLEIVSFCTQNFRAKFDKLKENEYYKFPMYFQNISNFDGFLFNIHEENKIEMEFKVRFLNVHYALTHSQS